MARLDGRVKGLNVKLQLTSIFNVTNYLTSMLTECSYA